MNKEEIIKMFRRIELDKTNDSCGFEFADGFGCTFDNIAICYDDRLKLYELTKQLEKENQELKKQLEEYKHKGLYNTCLPYSTGYKKAIKEKENQQKEFINWLEENYEITQDIWYIKILNKYKEIIGGKE